MDKEKQIEDTLSFACKHGKEALGDVADILLCDAELCKALIDLRESLLEVSDAARDLAINMNKKYCLDVEINNECCNTD